MINNIKKTRKLFTLITIFSIVATQLTTQTYSKTIKNPDDSSIIKHIKNSLLNGLNTIKKNPLLSIIGFFSLAAAADTINEKQRKSNEQAKKTIITAVAIVAIIYLFKKIYENIPADGAGAPIIPQNNPKQPEILNPEILNQNPEYENSLYPDPMDTKLLDSLDTKITYPKFPKINDNEIYPNFTIEAPFTNTKNS